ncbi:uncharacterized protein LOC135805391 [Sycon ciliatum]|uniref:uncharacterized protein LOC135805391 n=1 Tax=Sycon ciliatum TaxID=27933 RepID=UPI0031F63AB1
MAFACCRLPMLPAGRVMRPASILPVTNCRSYSALSNARLPQAVGNTCRRTSACPTSSSPQTGPVSLVQSRFASSSSLLDWFVDWRKEREEQQAEKAKFRKFAMKDLIASGPGDLAQLRATKGKPLEAPNEATPLENSPMFPLSRGHDCFNNRVRMHELLKGQVCVIIVTFRNFAWRFVPYYMDHLEQKCGDNMKKIKIINLYGFEKPVYHIVKPMMKFFMRRRTPPEKKETTVFLTRRSTLHFRFITGVSNCIPAWVLVIDHMGRLRWKAVGKPLERELHALTNIIDTLVKEAEEAKPSMKKTNATKRSWASLDKEL